MSYPGTSVPPDTVELPGGPMYRQGDVLIIPVGAAEVPARAPVPRDPRGRMVLARGEATGHAHVVGGPGLQLLADLDDPDRMFVEVPAHGRITPRGARPD